MGCSCCKSLKAAIFPCCGSKKGSRSDENGFSYHFDDHLVGRLRVHQQDLQVNLCPNPPSVQKAKNRRFSYMRALQETEESSVESLDPPGLNTGDLLENQVFGSRNTIGAFDQAELQDGNFYRFYNASESDQSNRKSMSIPANLHVLR